MSGLAPTPRVRSGALLTVASYNIHRCVGTDGRLDQDRVSTVIHELDADILALQEIQSKQSDELARATGYEVIAGPLRQQRREPFGNALFTRLGVCEVRRIDLCMPGREPRGALDVELECGDQGLRVIAAHLGLRAHERRRQIACILLALREGPDRPAVVLGDFNHWLPHRGPLRALDAHLGRAPALRTFPSWRPLLALDRVWAHPRGALVTLEVHATPLARWASDHLPLRAWVRVP